MRKPQKTDCGSRRKARTPESVVTWDDFVLSVNAASWQDEPSYPPPALYNDFEIDNEMDVEIALHHNVFRPLKSLLPQTHRFGRHNSFNGIIGESDRTLIGLDELYLAVEVKTKWVLSTDDMVATFSQNVQEHQAGITAAGSIYNALRQIFGYLSYNHLRYGVFTAYDQTWFLYRPPQNPGELHVSLAVQHDQLQSTLLQCFFHIVSLALAESKCDFAPPSPPLPQNPSTYESQSQDDDNSKDPSYKDVSKYGLGKRKREEYDNAQGNHGTGGSYITTIYHSINMSNQEEHMDLDSIMYDPSSFNVLSVLGGGRSSTVFEAVLYGKKVALKICDLW